MTLPSERTRSVIRTREFLYRLASPYEGGIKGIKAEVRAEARSLLRHFPHWSHLGSKDSFDEATATQAGLESDEEWLRTVEQWRSGFRFPERRGAMKKTASKKCDTKKGGKKR